MPKLMPLHYESALSGFLPVLESGQDNNPLSQVCRWITLGLSMLDGQKVISGGNM